MPVITNDDKIYLEDKQEAKIINLKETQKYEFYALPDDDPDRFVIHISLKDINPDPLKSDELESVNIYSANSDVYVQLPEMENSHIYVYDLMGQLVLEQKGQSNMLNKIRMNTKAGIYIVKVVDNDSIYSEKVYIK